MGTDIVEHIAKLARTKTEYDIIPHVDSEKHDLIQEVDESFGICSCVASLYWKANYEKLLLEGNLPIDVSYFLLLFVPACLVVWNRRKSFVETGSLSPLEELAFTSLILRRHPRVTEALQQRQWILQRIISSSDTLDLSTEVDFCELLAEKHRCNYAVWDYRRWLFKERLVRSPNVVRVELSRHLSWLSARPTDASGWSYRAHLLEVWKGEERTADSESDNAFLTQLWREMGNVDSILRTVPENEPVWVYRRLLDALFMETTEDPSSLPAFDCLAAAQQQPTKNSPAQGALIPLTNTTTTAPAPFSGAWASRLYNRHIHWLQETILPRFVGSPHSARLE